MGVSQKIGQYLWGRPSAEGRGEAKAPVAPETGAQGRAAGSATGVAAPDEGVELPGTGETEERVDAMDEERLQILKMVEEHKITAGEASKLLSALEVGGKPAEPATGRPPRWLRIRVTDVATGRTKVNVNVPLGVVSAAGKLGARFGLGKLAEREGIDLDELFEAIRGGAEGKLVDVTDHEDREHVEVYLE